MFTPGARCQNVNTFSYPQYGIYKGGMCCENAPSAHSSILGQFKLNMVK